MSGPSQAQTRRTVFTIGYQGADPGSFGRALSQAGVSLVADVRALSASRKQGFSKTALRESLARQGIAYEHLRALGTPKPGREAARAGDAAGLRRIYGATLQTPEAAAAFDHLAELASERPVCLMCFERDPRFCHRRILAEKLAERGFACVDLTPE